MHSPHPLSAHYDERVSHYGPSYKVSDYRCYASFWQRKRRLQKWLAKSRAKKIIDLGCGPGLITNFLAKDNLLFGADISPAMALLAKNVMRPVAAPAEKLPFKEASFDIALAVEMIQHLAFDQIAPLVKEISRVLKKEGVFILSSLNQTSWLHSLLRPCGGYQNLSFHPLKPIYKILEREGLTPLKTAFLNFPFFLDWETQNQNAQLSTFATSWMIYCVKN